MFCLFSGLLVLRFGNAGKKIQNLQGLKPNSVYRVYAGAEAPASERKLEEILGAPR